MINNNQLGLMKNSFKSLGYVIATGVGTCLISLGGTKPVVGAHLSFTNFSNVVEQEAESLEWIERLKFEDSRDFKFETFLTKNRTLSETLIPTKTTVENFQIVSRSPVEKANAELTPDKTGEGKLVGSTSLTYPETISESEVYSNSIVEPLDSLLSDGSGMTNLPSFSLSPIEPIPNTKIVNTTKEPEKIAGDLPISTVQKVTQTTSSNTSNENSGSEPTGETLKSTNDKETSEDSSLQSEIVARSEETTSVELSSTFIQKSFNIIALVSGGITFIVLIVIDYRRNHC